MKTKWQRPAVIVTGYTVMETPKRESGQRIPKELRDLRDEWLRQGVTPTIVFRRLRDDWGFETSIDTHRGAIRNLKASDDTVDPTERIAELERRAIRRLETGESELDHGKADTYKKGCRCEPCKEAKRVINREYRARRRAEGTTASPRKRSMAREIEHGTLTAYSGARCRCEPCKEANSVYQKAYREKKRATV